MYVWTNVLLGMVPRVHICISTAIKLFRDTDSLSSGLRLIIKYMLEQMLFDSPFALRFFVFLLKSHKAFVLYLAIYFIGIISNIRDTSFAYFFRRGCGGYKSLPLRGTPIFSSTPHPLRLY